MNEFDGGCAAELNTAQLCCDENTAGQACVDKNQMNNELQELRQNLVAQAKAGNADAADKLVELYCTGQLGDKYGKEAVEAYMLGLGFGNATAMCELACCCLDNKVADELVQQIANNKSFKAKLNELARKYALGFAKPDSDCEAFQLFKLGGNQNDPDVLCALARAYQFGWGTAKDVAKAVECYVRAADTGSYEAMKRLHRCKDENVDKQLKAAFEHFKQQADAGNANAQFAGAFCYCYGIGVAKSSQLAIEMCHSAENQQNSNAMVLLGDMYEYGYAVGQNRARAFELFKQAANAENGQGQYSLGWCYRNVNGVAKDYKQAAFWFGQAAAQGHPEAAYNLGCCYKYGFGVEKDISKAFQYFKQAAIAGNDAGQYNAGDCYQNGNGVKENYNQAVYWYQKAVDQKYHVQQYFDQCFQQLSKTQSSCTSFLQTKTTQAVSATQQHTIAFFLTKFAAASGCYKALFCLGDCYFNGVGTEIDIVAAAKCYERGEPSDSKKYLNLAKCLETGQVNNTNEVHCMTALNKANAVIRKEINEIQSQMQ